MLGLILLDCICKCFVIFFIFRPLAALLRTCDLFRLHVLCQQFLKTTTSLLSDCINQLQINCLHLLTTWHSSWSNSDDSETVTKLNTLQLSKELPTLQTTNSCQNTYRVIFKHRALLCKTSVYKAFNQLCNNCCVIWSSSVHWLAILGRICDFRPADVVYLLSAFKSHSTLSDCIARRLWPTYWHFNDVTRSW